MENIFVYMLFGHLFGDYFLQNDWMAQNKKKKTWEGRLACFIHCSLYTVCVVTLLSVIMYTFTPIQVILIFISHWIFDRYEFIENWCNINGIRSWKSEISDKSLTDSASIKDSINISFGSFVNIVQDNTLHLFFMYLILTI